MRVFILIVLFCCLNVISGSIFSWFYETYEKGMKQIEAEGRLPKPRINTDYSEPNHATNAAENSLPNQPKNNHVREETTNEDFSNTDEPTASSLSSDGIYLHHHDCGGDKECYGSPKAPSMERQPASDDHSSNKNEFSKIITSEEYLVVSKQPTEDISDFNAESEYNLNEKNNLSLNYSTKISEFIGTVDVVHQETSSSNLSGTKTMLDEPSSKNLENTTHIDNYLPIDDDTGKDIEQPSLKDSLEGKSGTNLKNLQPIEMEEFFQRAENSVGPDEPNLEAEKIGLNSEFSGNDLLLPNKLKSKPESHSSQLQEDTLNLPNEDLPSNVMRSDSFPDIQVDPIVSFELLPTDEKFLEEASSLLAAPLSSLDMCQHRLVLSLKQQCQTLLEDDLGKFAVNLLNCQASAESRRLYPCYSHMTLQECTRDMDGVTWNAYLLMSNRALAVCSAARQRLFAAQAQLTVDKLLYTAQLHSSSMALLKEQQTELQQTTADTLSALWSGQQALQQEQQQLSTSLSNTSAMLGRQRAWLLSQHHSAVSLAASLMRRIASAQAQVSAQSAAQQTAHVAVLHSLHALQQRAASLHKASEQRARRLVLSQQQSMQHQQRLHAAVLQLTASVQHVQHIIDDNHARLHASLSWITALLAVIGDHVDEAVTVMLHTVMLLLLHYAATLCQVGSVRRFGASVAVVGSGAWAVMAGQGSGHSYAILGAVIFTIFFGPLVLRQTTPKWLRFSAPKSLHHKNNNNNIHIADGEYSSDDESVPTSGPHHSRRATKYVSRTPASAHRTGGDRMNLSAKLPYALTGTDNEPSAGRNSALSPNTNGGNLNIFSEKSLGITQNKYPVNLENGHATYDQQRGGGNGCIDASQPHGKITSSECNFIDRRAGELPSKLEQLQRLLAPAEDSPTVVASKTSNDVRERLRERNSRSRTPTLNRSSRGAPCSALCKSGLPCRNVCLPHTLHCRAHTPSSRAHSPASATLPY